MNQIDLLRRQKINYYHKLSSDRKIISLVVIFIKRIIRKLLGFLFIPVIEEINEYNERLLDVLDCQRSGSTGIDMGYDAIGTSKKLQQHHIEELSGYCIGDEVLLSRYADENAQPLEGYYTDFTGVRTSPTALSGLRDRIGKVIKDLPFPDDSVHAPTIEYCSLYHVIEHSKDTFTMFELGAGWGPWMAYAAQACKVRGITNINVIGIEGETNKIPLIKEHLYINGFRSNNEELSQHHEGVFSKIINGIVDIEDGIVDFPEVDVDSYDATILETTSIKANKMLTLPAFSIETLLADYDKVDFVHFDIQGHEYSVIKSAIAALTSKVRFMCIGTHSRKIEGDLIELLSEKGWQLLREFPCLFNKDCKSESLIDRTFFDGTQFWQNISDLEGQRKDLGHV